MNDDYQNYLKTTSPITTPNHRLAFDCCGDDRNNNIGGDQYFGKLCRPKAGQDRAQRNHQSDKYRDSQGRLRSNNTFFHCGTALRIPAE